jgi:hypothetical protein
MVNRGGVEKMKGKRTLILITTFVLFVGLCYCIYIFNQKPLSFVSISINPDVELAVNGDNIVEDVIPINEDADIITSDLDLIGDSIEEASEKIIDAAIETGYIDEYSEDNAVIVTSTDEDEEIRDNLLERVTTRLNERLQEKNIYGVVVANGVNETIKEEALEYNVSNGKMLLIDRAVAINSELTKEDLSTMSIKDIQSEIKSYVKERHDDLKTARKELKAKWQEEKQVLRKTYQDKINELKASLLENTNVSVDELTEEQKNNIIREKLQNKKEEIKEKVNQVKNEISETARTGDYSEIREKINSVRERVRNNID